MPEFKPNRAPETLGRETGTNALPRIPGLRIAALAIWSSLLLLFWLEVRGSGEGAVGNLLTILESFVQMPWAPAGLLLLYFLRPLLLMPVTLLNLAAGLLLGPFVGLALALAGTLVSASTGYGIGRLLSSERLVQSLSARWRFVRLLRRRSLEAVVGGGLMYLHADMVNLPAGVLRVHFPTFLLGITLGNSLTLTMAVMAGSSVEDSLMDASKGIDLRYLALAVTLLLLSLVLARLLRRRFGARV